jgi:DNA-binding LytR/AlgR family response regulator
MQILIIEDEKPAARRLEQLIRRYQPQAQIAGQMESVKSAVSWLVDNPPPSLMFVDIQLADNLSFEIFNQVKVESPVIFTTAYDQYTLQAFKLNSIDYLLKPIDEEELEQALQKYHRFFGQQPSLDKKTIQRIMKSFVRPSYKERFIVKAGQQLSYISVEDIHYFYAEGGLAFAQMKDRKRHAIEYTLDSLEPILHPSYFFRINRKVITHIKAIHKVAPYFNSRLALSLLPQPDFDVIVSRDRVSDFKAWLDQ